MLGDLNKWSILTKKEFKELDFTLKREYIKRYGKKFYKKQAEDGVYNQYRDNLDRDKTRYKTSKLKEKV
jgi:uncharacterized membrane protein YheB (UPF0754 family)